MVMYIDKTYMYIDKIILLLAFLYDSCMLMSHNVTSMQGQFDGTSGTMVRISLGLFFM